MITSPTQRAKPAEPRWAPLCPCCGAATERIARRWYQRIASLMVPARRYRCLSLRCGWQGTLRCG